MKTVLKRMLVILMAITMTVGMAPAVTFAAQTDDTEGSIAATGVQEPDWPGTFMQPTYGSLGEDDYANPYGQKPGRKFMLNEQNELMVLNGSKEFSKSRIVSMYDKVDFDKQKDINDTSVKYKDFKLADKVTELNFTQAVAFDPTGSGRRDHVAIVGVDGSSQTWLYVYSTVNDKWSDGCQLNDMWWVDDSSDFYCMHNFISITAGDYDDDGKDSLVVYIAGEPNEGGKHDGYGLAEVKVHEGENGKIILPTNIKDRKNKELLNPEYVKNYEGIRDIKPGASDGRVRLMGVVRTGDIDNDLIDDLVVMSYAHVNSKDYSYLIKVPFLAANLGKSEDEIAQDGSFDITKDVNKKTEKEEDDFGYPVLSDYVQKNNAPPYNSMMTANMTVVNTDTKAGDEIILAGHYVDYKVNDGKYEDQSRKDKVNIAKYTYTPPDAGKSSVSLTQQYLSYKGKDLNGNSIDLNKNGFSNKWSAGDPGVPQISCQGVYMNGPTNPGYVEIGGDIYDCSSNAFDSVKKIYTNQFQKDQDKACNELLISENLVPYAVAGNFDENDFGYEQVVMTLVRKQDNEDDYVVSYQIVGSKNDKHKEKTGMIPDSDLHDAFYEQETKYELFNKGDNLDETLSCNIVTVDADDDGIMARYGEDKNDNERRICVYADPQVEAILQCPPYFGELKEQTPCYALTSLFSRIEYNMHDFVGQGEGMTSTVTMEDGKTKERFRPFFNLSKERSFGSGHSETTQFTETYIHSNDKGGSAILDQDGVLVTRTPIVFYAYDLYDPESKTWLDGAHIVTTSLEKSRQMFSVDAYNDFADDYNTYMESAVDEYNKKLEEEGLDEDCVEFGEADKLVKVDSEKCYLGIAPYPEKYLNRNHTEAADEVNYKILTGSGDYAEMPYLTGMAKTGTSTAAIRYDARSTAQYDTTNYAKVKGVFFRNKLGSYSKASTEISNTESKIEGSKIGIDIYLAGINLKAPFVDSKLLQQYHISAALTQWDSNIPADKTKVTDESKNYMNYVPVYGSYILYNTPYDKIIDDDPGDDDSDYKFIVPNSLTIKWHDDSSMYINNAASVEATEATATEEANEEATTEEEAVAEEEASSEEATIETAETVEPSSESMTISWQCKDSKYIDSFGIYRTVRDGDEISYEEIGKVKAGADKPKEFTYTPDEMVPFWEIRVCALNAKGKQISPMSNPAFAFAPAFFDKLRSINVNYVDEDEEKDVDPHYEFCVTKVGEEDVILDNIEIKSISKVSETEDITEYKVRFLDKEKEDAIISVKNREGGIESIERIDGEDTPDSLKIQLKDGRTFDFEVPAKITVESDSCDKNPEGQNQHAFTTVNFKKPGKTSGYSGDIVCKYCGKVIQKGEILPATEAGDARLSATKYTYNGKTHQPTVTVDDMTLNKDYTVKWSGNGKNVGKYNATVHFKEANVNTVLSFDVVPAGAKIKKATRGKKYFKARWYKQSKKMSTSRITGYQVQYSTSSSFANAKTVTVKGYKKTSKKIKKLKRKTKYYVHVRTYKTVSGVKYYSNWSSVKSVKTR